MIRYQHVRDGEIVDHQIAPFDIGTINLKTRESYKDNVYAYSYTHINKKTQLLDPRVCPFNISSFIDIREHGDFFNEIELTDLNLLATGYDYRKCDFNLARNPKWFQ
jgi:hypothetical protein